MSHLRIDWINRHGLIHFMKRYRRKVAGFVFCLLFLTLTVAPNRCAGIDPLEIELLSTKYSTFVSTWGNIEPGGDIIVDSRTLVSFAPLSDSLYHPITGNLEALAETDTFEISTFTIGEKKDPLRISSFASATTQLTFKPVVGGTAPIDFEFFGAYEFVYSTGFVDANGWLGVRAYLPWLTALFR